MSRKRARQLANEIDASVTPEVIDKAIEKVASHTVGKGIDVPIKPKRFSPRPCSQCENDRPRGTNFSVVYHTSGNVRYCKCQYCRATWTQYFDNATMPMVVMHQKLSTIETGTPSCDHGDISIVVSAD